MDINLGFNANIQTGRPGFMVTVNMTSDFLAPVQQGQWVEAHGDVVKATRSLVFMEGRLYADGELSLRANAVMKAPRGLDEYDLSDALPPVYKV
jgi:acyl-coenzyme A thioesterase PaaI-like protein